MGFFGDRPRHAESEGGPTPVPYWPSVRRDGILPALVATHAVIFRSDELICSASGFEVYPDGVAFTLQAQLRHDVQPVFEEVPWDLHRGVLRDPNALPEDFMWFGVLDAEGSSWSNIDPPPVMSAPTGGPVVTMGSGSGSSRHWSTNHLLWPLPPPGPLTFIAEWPKYGLEESRATIDGTELRRAADGAEELWPSRPPGTYVSSL